MAEVSIHLENIAVVSFQSPLESSNVGSTQPEFSASLDDEETVGKLLLAHHSFDNSRRTVGRSVVNHQDVETFVQSEHCPDDFLNILLLVVGRYDDNAVALMLHTL